MGAAKHDAFAHGAGDNPPRSRPPAWVPFSLAYPARGVVRASLTDIFFERSSHWHWHGHVQVMVAIAGELVVRFRDSRDVTLPPMHAVAIPPETWHIPGAGAEGNRVLVFDLRIAASPANDLCEEIGVTDKPRTWRCHPPTLRRGVAELRRIARQLEHTPPPTPTPGSAPAPGSAAGSAPGSVSGAASGAGAAIVRAAWAALVTDPTPTPTSPAAPTRAASPDGLATRRTEAVAEGFRESEARIAAEVAGADASAEGGGSARAASGDSGGHPGDTSGGVGDSEGVGDAGGGGGSGGVDRRVLYVEQQMRADVAQPYDGAGLAAAVQLSVSQMGRLFRRYRGVSPLRRLQDFRMAQAEQYLVYSTLSVKQIAARCGFGSTDHFTRQFRERTGLPPRDYRQRHRPPSA